MRMKCDADEAARIEEMRKRMEGMFSGAEAEAAPATEDATDTAERPDAADYCKTAEARPRHAALDAAEAPRRDEGPGRGTVHAAGGPGRPRRRPGAAADRRQHPGPRRFRQRPADLRGRRRGRRAVLCFIRVRVPERRHQRRRGALPATPRPWAAASTLSRRNPTTGQSVCGSKIA